MARTNPSVRGPSVEGKHNVSPFRCILLHIACSKSVPKRNDQQLDAKGVKEGDTTLGKVRIYPAVDGKRPEVTLHLNELDVELPKQALKPVNDYKFRFNSDVPKLRVFSEGDGGVEMQGIVEDSCILQPTRSKAYTNFQKSRNKIASIKTAVVKEMSYADERKQLNSKKRRIIHIKQERVSNKKMKKSNDSKVLTEKELRDAIFGEFVQLAAIGK